MNDVTVGLLEEAQELLAESFYTEPLMSEARQNSLVKTLEKIQAHLSYIYAYREATA